MARHPPRPSLAPRLIHNQREDPYQTSCANRDVGIAIPRSRSPHPRSRHVAPSQRQNQKSANVPIPARDVEHVLGHYGSTLVHCCRESGASITLRPELVDGSDDFIAEVHGPLNAIVIACQLLREIMHGGSGVDGMDGHDHALSTCDEGAYDACDVEDCFEIPRNRVPFVLGGRRSGDKGIGKKEGIKELEQKTGSQLLVLANDDPSSTLLLQIRGLPGVVEEVKHILDQRLEGCEHLLEDSVDCPVLKLPLFCGKAAHALEEMERASGACVNIKRGKQNCFEREDGEQVCQIEVVGTQEQIQHAASLVQTRLEWAADRDEGRGKGKRRGKS